MFAAPNEHAFVESQRPCEWCGVRKGEDESAVSPCVKLLWVRFLSVDWAKKSAPWVSRVPTCAASKIDRERGELSEQKGCNVYIFDSLGADSWHGHVLGALCYHACIMMMIWCWALACVAQQSKQILCKDRILFWGGDFLWRGAPGERRGECFFVFVCFFFSFFLLSVSFPFRLCFLLCLLVLFGLACMACIAWFRSMAEQRKYFNLFTKVVKLRPK